MQRESCRGFYLHVNIGFTVYSLQLNWFTVYIGGDIVVELLIQCSWKLHSVHFRFLGN